MPETFRLIKRRDAESEPNAPRLIKSRGGNRAVAAEPEQTPEETRSLLSQAGGVGLSGLHTVGSILSAPSRLLWGGINAATGGEGGWGNTSLLDSTGGIELSNVLGNAGVIAKNDPTKWEYSDFGRGLVDIVGDPTSWLTPLGLTKAGVAASKTSKGVTKGLVNSVRAGERGLLSFHHPLSVASRGAIGTGGDVADALQDVGAKTGLTSLVRIAAQSPPVTKLKELFHNSSMGMKTHATQTRLAEPAFEQIGDNLAGAQLAVNNTVRNMEGRVGGPIDKATERHIAEMGNPSPEILPLKQMDDANHLMEQDLGIPTGDLDNSSVLSRIEKLPPEQRGNLAQATGNTVKNSITNATKPFTRVGEKRALRTDYLDANGNVVHSIDNTAGGAHVHPDAVPVNYFIPNTPTGYVPRHISEGAEWGGQGATGSRVSMSAENSLDQHRNEKLFGNLPSDLVNRIFVSSGKFRETLPAHLTDNQRSREIGRHIIKEFGSEAHAAGLNLTGNYLGDVILGKVHKVTGEPIRRVHSRVRELGQFINSAPQLTKVGPFTNHPVHDYHTSLKASAEQIPKAQNAIRFIAEQAAVNHGESLDVLRRNGMDNGLPPTVREAAGKLGLTVDKVGKHVLGQLPPRVLAEVNKSAGDVAMKRATHHLTQGDKIAYDSLGNPRPLDDIAKDLFPRIRDQHVLDLQLPSGEFKSLTGFMAPPPQDLSGGFLSGLNTMWKANMLAWPATQIRNAGSAAVQAGLKGHAGLSDLYSGAQLARGQQVSGLAKHPEVASLMASQGIDETEAVRRLVGAYVPASNSIASEIPIGQIGSELTDLGGNVPGRVPVAAHEAFTGPLGALVGYRDGQHVGLNAINPAAIANVLGHKETGYGPAMAANMVARNVEQPIRMGSVMGLMRQGHSAKSAAKQVGEAQGNYGNREFSEFEKTRIKPYVPFYAFNSRMGKQVLSELASNPGGRLGTLLKAENRMQGSDPSIPDSVSSGTAIPFPWGQPDDGTKRYLSGLGLMHESPVHTLGALAGGNTRGFLYDMAGMLNPLIKSPLEHMAGQSFYQRGEPQEHLDPNIGRILSNVGVMSGLRDKDAGPVNYLGQSPTGKSLETALETALAVSPFSRMATTAKQLTDNRKGIGAKAINTLTGARLTDVSPDKQRFTIQRRAKKLALSAGARSHEDVYFSKTELQKLKETDPVLHKKQVQLQAILKNLNRKQAAKK